MSGSWGAREAGQKPGERAENVATRREVLAYAVPPNWDSPPLPRLEEQVRKDLGELGTEVVTVVTRARQLANLNFSNLLDHKNRDRKRRTPPGIQVELVIEAKEGQVMAIGDRIRRRGLRVGRKTIVSPRFSRIYRVLHHAALPEEGVIAAIMEQMQAVEVELKTRAATYAERLAGEAKEVPIVYVHWRDSSQVSDAVKTAEGPIWVPNVPDGRDGVAAVALEVGGGAQTNAQAKSAHHVGRIASGWSRRAPQPKEPGPKGNKKRHETLREAHQAKRPRRQRRSRLGKADTGSEAAEKDTTATNATAVAEQVPGDAGAAKDAEEQAAEAKGGDDGCRRGDTATETAADATSVVDTTAAAAQVLERNAASGAETNASAAHVSATAVENRAAEDAAMATAAVATETDATECGHVVSEKTGDADVHDDAAGTAEAADKVTEATVPEIQVANTTTAAGRVAGTTLTEDSVADQDDGRGRTNGRGVADASAECDTAKGEGRTTTAAAAQDAEVLRASTGRVTNATVGDALVSGTEAAATPTDEPVVEAGGEKKTAAVEDMLSVEEYSGCRADGGAGEYDKADGDSTGSLADGDVVGVARLTHGAPPGRLEATESLSEATATTVTTLAQQEKEAKEADKRVDDVAVGGVTTRAKARLVSKNVQL